MLIRISEKKNLAYFVGPKNVVFQAPTGAAPIRNLTEEKKCGQFIFRKNDYQLLSNF